MDDKLQQTLRSLQENADKSMQEMNEALIRKQNVFNKALDEQQEIFKNKIKENGGLLDELKKLDDVALAINLQSEKLDAELEGLNLLKAEITQIGSEQSKKMDELINAVENMSMAASIPNPSKYIFPIKLSLPIKIMLILFVVLGTIVFFFMFVYFLWSIILHV